MECEDSGVLSGESRGLWTVKCEFIHVWVLLKFSLYLGDAVPV